MNPLHPNVITLWRLTGVIGTLLASAPVAALEFVVLGPRLAALPFTGAITSTIALLGLGMSFAWPALRYRHWAWDVEPDQVVIEKGVLWRSRSLVPRVRIQHVDTRTSPLQRWFGLSSLVIYTAGTRGADAELPGLTSADAERLRDELARLEELDERGG